MSLSDTANVTAPYTDTNPRGANAVLFEVANPYPVPAALTANAVGIDEESSSSITLAASALGGSGLALGIVATTGSNASPTLSGVTAQASATGTSVSASPRGVTGFAAAINSGTVSASASFGTTLNNYGILFVMPPA